MAMLNNQRVDESYAVHISFTPSKSQTIDMARSTFLNCQQGSKLLVQDP